ncbi:MAG TPA: hypothetical protein VGD64_05680 [Acidisarcina sp.]
MTAKIAALLIALATRFPCYAQQTPSVTIKEPGSETLASYVKGADLIAVVTVVAGDTESYGVPIYKGKVLTAYKGTVAGQTIFFGPFVGTRLGWEYVLFLRSVKGPLAPKEGHAVSYGTIHYGMVFNEGYSSMETSYECSFPGNQQCDYGVRVCTDYVRLPEDTPTAPPMTETTTFGCRWCERPHFYPC